MKRLLFLCVLSMVIATGFAMAEALTPKALTVMVYMCGSNLETLSGSATADIDEMLQSNFDADQVNLVVMAGGSRRWDKDLRSGEAGTIEFFRKRGALKKKLVRPESDVNMGDPDTLTDFIQKSLRLYPAEEYALIIWDHGAGPLEGVCLDEVNEPDRISLSGLVQALDAAALPKKLSWIGFDACLMGTLEVADAVAPYANYMIASEETEPSTGWDYTFLEGIEADTDGLMSGKRIIDLYMQTPCQKGEVLTLSCTDLSKIEAVIATLDDFFQPIAGGIDRKKFAALSNLRLSAISPGRAVHGFGVDGYDLVDLRDLCMKYQAENDPQPLLETLKDAVRYVRSTSTDAGGLSVYHPYYNKAMFRENWASKYRSLSFCESYSKYVQRFGELLDGEGLADWQDLQTVDDGYDQNNENWFSLKLTPEQREAFSSAQLLALYPHVTRGSERFSETVGIQERTFTYSPIFFSNATLDKDDRLTAYYAGRALYVTDSAGNAILGPLSYRLSADGKTYYIFAQYSDTSGREDSAASAPVMFSCEANGTDILSVVTMQVYDPLTETYTNRIQLNPKQYTRLAFDSLAARRPIDASPMPGFDEWETILEYPGSEYYHYYTGEIDLYEEWQLRFFDFQQSGLQTYIAFQITDVQQNTYLSEMLPVNNPNLERIEMLPEHIDTGRFDVKCYMVRDISPMDPTISVCLEFNDRDWNDNVTIRDVLLGDDAEKSAERSATYKCENNTVRLSGPDDPKKAFIQIKVNSFTGFKDVKRLEIVLDHGESPLVFFPISCDVSDIAPESSPVLGEDEYNGVTMQLVKLERGQGGAINGVLRVVNRSEAYLYSLDDIVINGLRLQGSIDWVNVRPHTDAYIAFSMQDSAYLAGQLKIEGRNNSRFLTMDRLLSRFVGETVSQIKVMNTFGYELEAHWQLDLTTPIFVGRTEENAGLATLDTLPLLRGEISVDVERVLIADNGVAVRMIMRNDTDEDASIVIQDKLLNGMDVDSYNDSYTIAAHGVTVACMGIVASKELNPGYEIGDIGFAFRYKNYTSDTVRITFDHPVALSTVNGAYLSIAGLTTQPTRIVRTSVSSRFEGEKCGLRVSVGLVNDSHYSCPEKNALNHGLSLGVTIELENRNDIEVDAITSNFVLNGDYETESEWIKYDIAPHSKVVGTWFVEPEALFNLGQIHSLQCVMNIRESSNYRWDDLIESIPINVEFDEIDIRKIANMAEPLCETEVDGIVWRLMSVEADADGRLTGWLNAVNTTDITREYVASAVLAEGIRGDDHLPKIKLEPHKYQDIPFTFENDVRLFQGAITIPGTTGYAKPHMDHILQRRGIREITHLSFAMGLKNIYIAEDKTPEQFFTFTLPEPLVLDAEAFEETSGELLVHEAEVSVRLESVILGNRGISMAIEVENQSNQTLVLYVNNGFWDGNPAYFQTASQFRTVLPHTIDKYCVMLYGLPPGDVIQSIYIPFSVDDGINDSQDCGFVLIRFKEPMKLDSPEGTLLTYGDYDIEPVNPAVNMLPLPAKGMVRPTRLIAPISADKASRFDHGEAVLCLENPVEDGEMDDMESFSCEHVKLTLAPDAMGQISAQYSGLIMCWSGIPAIADEHTDGDISEISATLYEYSEGYFEYEIQPGNNPGDAPNLIPTDIPWNYEEGMVMNKGIKSTYRYTIQNVDGELRLLDSSVEHQRMSPDDPPGLEENYGALIAVVIQNEYLDQNYDEPSNTWSELGIYDERSPSMDTVESFVGQGIKMVVRYHIWYTDETEEILVEDY